MKIGMTYDLKDDYLKSGYNKETAAEFDSEDTIFAIENALREQGHRTDRIGNIKALTRRLAVGDKWDLVFNIAEGAAGFGREAQVPALLDAYGIPYTFSDPLVLSITLHKAMTKHIVRDLGINTPDFTVIESEADVKKIGLPFPLFVKPVAEGTSKGISATSIVSDIHALKKECTRILNLFHQPVLVETYLPGREFTIGIIGTGKKAECLGVLEVLLNGNAEEGAYSYQNKEHFKERVIYRLANDSGAREAARLAIDVWRGLGCRDGGRVDVRNDGNGAPSFIEVNPLAGLHPENSDLCILASHAGITYGTLIERLVRAALDRIPYNYTCKEVG
ncbi:MAG: hypothetical protein M0P57_07585 [Syntrophales bacterium]|jgi:D-alanine-D-alanine ligase|nr:hypothetical protein [Syntrophales bacterium]MDY0043194.1 hypothetical protein [Syntrophales bacterium]